MKKCSIIVLFIILLFFINGCSTPPDSAFLKIEQYLQLRQKNSIELLYGFYNANFKEEISLEKFIEFERIYKKKFGKLEEFKLKRWSKRKNFSFGKDSGSMFVFIYLCTYQYGNTEETFTLIENNKQWKIFDYYLKPR
ncbi:MAG: hypothetical protein KKH98_14115 [Spirochaetes bacterium]|nr:hypothetical protein [Spirochaetota bacterium]